MVRINLINPRKLADQHLIAEYNEILMLLGYVRKNSALNGIPEDYTLGKGHIKFFKDKLKYLKNRHELIKKEMRRRNFKPTKSVSLNDFNKTLRNNWQPKPNDFNIIKERIKLKIASKPDFYRYLGEKRSPEFLINLLN